MAEFEDSFSERMAQLEQEDLERYQRDILKNSSYSYDDENPNYVDEFESKLSVLLEMVRGFINDPKRTTSLIENGSEPLTKPDGIIDEAATCNNSNFRFEPAGELHSDEDLVVKAVKEINEMADRLPIEIEGYNMCDLVDKSIENNHAHRLFDEMTESIHAGLLAEQMHTELDLQLESTFSNVKLIEEYDCYAFGEMFVPNGACNVFDKMSKPNPSDFQLEEEYYDIVVTGKVELGKVQEVFAEIPAPFIANRQPFYIEYFNDITLFDPGGNILYTMSSSEGVLAELLGIALGTGDKGEEGGYWGKFVMEGDKYNVFKEMPKSNSTSKGFIADVRYGRYTENEVATQSSNTHESQFSLTPNEQNLKTLKLFKLEQYESHLHCINSEIFLNYSQVFGEFSAYIHLVIELCCCFYEWVKSRDIKINGVLNMCNGREVWLWNCNVPLWRRIITGADFSTATHVVWIKGPNADFHITVLGQMCTASDQATPRLRNVRVIGVGKALVHFTAADMISQNPFRDEHFLIILNSNSNAVISLILDSIAHRDSFYKSLFEAANSMIMSKCLYCWTFSWDRLTYELRFVSIFGSRLSLFSPSSANFKGVDGQLIFMFDIGVSSWHLTGCVSINSALVLWFAKALLCFNMDGGCLFHNDRDHTLKWEAQNQVFNGEKVMFVFKILSRWIFFSDGWTYVLDWTSSSGTWPCWFSHLRANFVWDPGKNVISFYIIEDNDVLKRKGIEIQLVWALKQDDQKLNVASAHYYARTGIIACSLADCEILSLLITSSVRSVGFDSIDPNARVDAECRKILPIISLNGAVYCAVDIIQPEEHCLMNEPCKASKWLGTLLLLTIHDILHYDVLNALLPRKLKTVEDAYGGYPNTKQCCIMVPTYPNTCFLSMVELCHVPFTSIVNIQVNEKFLSMVDYMNIKECIVFSVIPTALYFDEAWFVVRIGNYEMPWIFANCFKATFFWMVLSCRNSYPTSIVVHSNFLQGDAMSKIFVWDPGVYHFTTLRTRRFLRGRSCHELRSKIRDNTEGASVKISTINRELRHLV